MQQQVSWWCATQADVSRWAALVKPADAISRYACWECGVFSYHLCEDMQSLPVRCIATDYSNAEGSLAWFRKVSML